MSAARRWLGRVSFGIAAMSVAAVSGCAARAEYVYDEPVVHPRPARVYVAPPPPPPVIIYREHRHYHAPPPRVHRAPPPRVHRPPPARRPHHHHDRDR